MSGAQAATRTRTKKSQTRMLECSIEETRLRKKFPKLQRPSEKQGAIDKIFQPTHDAVHEDIEVLFERAERFELAI